jgi:microcystin-dependent protein
MAEPFLSEIRMMSFNFPPKGWATCDGQLLPINQNQALFSLLGTTYGGDGRVNFGLPDLRGRVPTHTGGMGHILGEVGGEQNHALLINEIPAHAHQVTASSDAGATPLPGGNFLANSSPNLFYGALQNLTSLRATTVSNVGGSLPHQNMQPYLTINFSIALQGIFPSQN